MSNYTGYCKYVGDLERQILKAEKDYTANQKDLDKLYTELYKARIVLSKGAAYIDDSSWFDTYGINKHNVENS